MQGYRIRRGSNERSVADAAALLQLAAAGQVHPTDEIATDDGWIPAARFPLLRGRLGGDDPWSAWSDIDEVDAASLYRRMVDEPPDVPQNDVLPVSRRPVPGPADGLGPDPPTDEVIQIVPPRRTGPPVVVPPPRSEPLPLPATRPERPPLGPDESREIIDFPRARPPMLDLDAMARAQRARTGPPPIVRSTRVVAMVVAGIAVILLGYAWIRMSAYSTAGVSERPSTVREVTATRPSPFALLDAELRQSLTATPRPIEGADDLSNALLVELVQLRLDVVSAEGAITKWVGRNGSEPRTAEVRIRYRSGGDISRELAAIALVVGRYKRVYRLEMPVFQVTELGTNGVTAIDPDRAESYYQARLSLEDLLASIVGKG